MKLFQRIKNIWHLSEIELPAEKRTEGLKESVKKKFSRHAIIVSMRDPIRDLEL